MQKKLRSAIRAAIRNGTSLNALATKAGIHYASLHAFHSGKGGIAFETAEKLCRVLGLTLTENE